MSKVYLVTGANSGVGLDACRQLALMEETKVILMACRTESKCVKAIDDLVAQHNISRDKLKFTNFNGSNGKEEMIQAATLVTEPLDGIVLNAGGYGNDASGTPCGPNNVLDIVQINLVGHIHYLDALVDNKLCKPGCRVVFAGSETSRGVPSMGIKAPEMPDTLEAYVNLMDGSAYEKFDLQAAYATTKGLAALYMSAWARRNPELFALTVSPGGTKGTSVSQHGALSSFEKAVFPVVQTVLGWMGQFHSVDVGAKRYVDAVTNSANFKDFVSGTFVASPGTGVVGDCIDQSTLEFGAQYASETKQDTLYEAMEKYR